MALDKSYIIWVDNDDGSEHIHFYDDNLSFDEFGQMLVDLGLATEVED